MPDGGVIPLTPFELSLAAALVILLSLLTWYLRLGMGKRLIIAGIRTVVQLLLLGLVLEYLFAIAHPALVGLLAMVMLLVAGREVMARQHRPFQGIWGYSLGSMAMFISSFTITFFALQIIVGPQPWYLP